MQNDYRLVEPKGRSLSKHISSLHTQSSSYQVFKSLHSSGLQPTKGSSESANLYYSAAKGKKGKPKRHPHHKPVTAPSIIGNSPLPTIAYPPSSGQGLQGIPSNLTFDWIQQAEASGQIDRPTALTLATKLYNDIQAQNAAILGASTASTLMTINAMQTMTEIAPQVFGGYPPYQYGYPTYFYG